MCRTLSGHCRIHPLSLKQELDPPRNDWSQLIFSDAKQQELTASHQKSGSLVVQCSMSNITIFWRADESGQITTRFLWHYHQKPIQEQRWNVWLLQLPGNHPTLHRWLSICQSPAQHAHANHRRRCKVPHEWQSLHSTAPISQHQDPGEADQEASLCGRHCPRRPHRASFTAHHILLCGRLTAVWPWNQPQENWGSSPANPREDHRSPHITVGQTEINTTVYLPGLHHLI